MRRILYAAAALAALLVVGRGVLGALQGDEDRIRVRMERMAEAFGNRRLGPIADGIGADFRDASEGLDRDDVLDSLRYLFFQHPRGPFPYRVELGNVEVRLGDEAEDPRSARVTLDATFLESPGDRAVWAIAIEADLSDGPDGWQLVSSTHATVDGARRGLSDPGSGRR